MTVRQKQQKEPAGRHRLTGWIIGVCAVAAMGLVIAIFLTEARPLPGNEYRQEQLGDDTLNMSHDNEMIMLIISLAVVVQIAAIMKFLRVLPYSNYLLFSFGCLLASAILTVAEGYLFAELFNYLEHLSYLASAILLAVWCGRVFMGKQQEGSR